MSDSEAKESGKRRNCRLFRARKACAVFAFLAAAAIFLPNSARASQLNSSGTVAIQAVVPFRQEFADAVARNSTIISNQNLVFFGQKLAISVSISSGEAILKNQTIIIKIMNQSGEVVYSEKARSGGDGKIKLDIIVNEKMIGKNSVYCRVETYKQPIILDKRIDFFVWPDFGDSLVYLQKVERIASSVAMLLFYI